MEHIAIDLGGSKSQVCIRRADGEIIDERAVRTRDLPRMLSSRDKSRVIVETCSEAFWVADAALEQGHEVRVVPATLVTTLGVGARRTKTDVRDARALSQVSCRVDLPSVHVPQMESRERKALCGMRDALVSARTKLINTVRGWMRTRAVRCRTGATETFAKRVRAAEPNLPPFVERQLNTIEMLTKQIDEADRDLVAMAEADPTCRQLMSMPGIGPLNALQFTAAIDRVDRFQNAHNLEAYLGLTPGEHSSSERVRRTSITKAGSIAVRRGLIQAAWVLRRVRPDDPMVRWSKEVEKRRGKWIAAVALARKMAGVLFAMWRDGTLYQPSKTEPRGDTA